MNDETGVMIACHVLRAACMKKGVDCQYFCLMDGKRVCKGMELTNMRNLLKAAKK